MEIFEWNIEKDILNREKHDLSFKQVVSIFVELRLELPARAEKKEERFRVIGLWEEKIVTVITHRVTTGNESFRPGGLGNMKKKSTKGSYDPAMSIEEWKRFHATKDEDIDTSDIPEITAEQWAQAKVIIPEKKPISIRVDDDILGWFKRHGKGYQSRMNAVLRAYVEAQTRQKR